MTTIGCVPTVFLAGDIPTSDVTDFVTRLQALVHEHTEAGNVTATVDRTPTGVVVRIECTRRGATTTIEHAAASLTDAAAACFAAMHRDLGY